MWQFIKQEILAPTIKLAPYLSGLFCFYNFCYKVDDLELVNIAQFIIFWPLSWMVLVAPIIWIGFLGEFSFSKIEKTPAWHKHKLSHSKSGYVVKIIVFTSGAILGPILLVFFTKVAYSYLAPIFWLLS